jgi:hypothetical protein
LLLLDPLHHDAFDIVLADEAKYVTGDAEGYDMVSIIVGDTTDRTYQIIFDMELESDDLLDEITGEPGTQIDPAITLAKRIGNFLYRSIDNMTDSLLMLPFARIGSKEYDKKDSQQADHQFAAFTEARLYRQNSRLTDG